MKHLKITQAGFENYTGDLSVYHFTEGLSDEKIGRNERDRIAAAMTCVEVDDDNIETPAGSTHRMVSDRAAYFEPVPPAQRMTEAEKMAEDKAFVMKALGANAAPIIYTEEELNAVADTGGISGLRAIAEPLNVKDRNLNVLVQKILAVQTEVLDRWTAARDERIAALDEDIDAPVPLVLVDIEDDDDSDIVGSAELTDVQVAAMGGDLSAALNKDAEPTITPVIKKAV